jgi:TatD DNase family protein
MAQPAFYDTHAHLDHSAFRGDFGAVLERAAAAGITRIVCVGTDADSSREAVALAERHPELYAVVGWHPSEAEQAPADIRPLLRELAGHPKVVALGETGLDYFRLPKRPPGQGASLEDPVKTRQADLFRQHLEVAAEVGLNVVVHQRAALEDTLGVIAPFAGRVRGQFHCFADDVAALERILALGSVVSFTGLVTFPKAGAARAALAAVPADRFMLETDSPYLAPVPHRGQRCEPAYVRTTAGAVAEVRGVVLEALSTSTCATAHAFFPRLR